MRKIKLKNWEEQLPDGTKHDVCLIDVFEMLINERANNIDRNKKIIGTFSNYRRIKKAFDDFDNKEISKDVLKIEDSEYEILREIIIEKMEKTPEWGVIKGLGEEVDKFLNIEEKKYEQ